MAVALGIEPLWLYIAIASIRPGDEQETKVKKSLGGDYDRKRKQDHTGCYNLSCAGFVQTSSSFHLGAGFSDYSIFDGPQYEIQLQYYLYQGNWWLSVGNTWVGYYPSSIYKGGSFPNTPTY